MIINRQRGALLYKFLKEQGVFQNFMVNVCKFRHVDVAEKNMKELLNFLGNYNNFSYAFIWSMTEEGQEFWYHLQSKWRKYLEQHRYGR